MSISPESGMIVLAAFALGMAAAPIKPSFRDVTSLLAAG